MSTPVPMLREMTGRARRLWVLGGVALVVVGTALAIWFGLSATSGVQVFNSGYRVVSDEELELRFDIRRDASREVACELTAYDEHHATVGRARLVVPPGTASESRHLGTVRTTSRALNGMVERCAYV